MTELDCFLNSNLVAFNMWAEKVLLMARELVPLVHRIVIWATSPVYLT